MAKSPKTQTAQEQVPTIAPVAGMTGEQLVQMLNRQVTESQGAWQKKGFELDKTTKENERWYLGRQVSDKDGEYEDSDDLTLDNRIFSSIRTIVPFVTTRITEPEVYPSSTKQAAKRFSEDFEKALHTKARKEKVKKKVKWALEDAMIRRRGFLKLRYDAVTKNFCRVEYVPCESIIVDHKAKGDEEPRYFRHKLDKTIEDLIVMFPDAKTSIHKVFGVDDKTDKAKMQTSHEINEDWALIVNEDGEQDLVVCWHYKDVPFGAIQDPNWNYEGINFLDNHMMPLIFFNVLNDGRSHIDKTSFVEQAKFEQRTIDKRSEQIGKNAGLGNIGMPVVDTNVLADDQAQFMTFEPDQVIELDVPESRSINDVFTTWKAGTLSPDVYNDRQDAIAGVQNTFGASAVMQGNQSENNTLGQDELLRDQSMGRQQEIVDAIDDAMERLYLLMAQFLLIYGDEQELFKYVGENSEFDYIILNTDSLDTDAEIQVKSGTSMPVDNPQRRATADKAAGQGMIDPLTYWDIMDQPNAQKYAKRLVDYQTNPQGFMADIKDELFNRDAFTDIELIKRGDEPPYRDDLDKEYFDYLNQYILSGNLENPQMDMGIRQAISAFIDIQLARGQKMLGMAETQLPTAQDVQAHNQQVDEANSAASDTAGSLPEQPAPQDAMAAPSPQPVQ